VAGKTPPAPARKATSKRAPAPARKTTSKRAPAQLPTSSDGDLIANRLTLEERAASGKAARTKTPLEAHADFAPAESRDPVGCC